MINDKIVSMFKTLECLLYKTLIAIVSKNIDSNLERCLTVDRYLSWFQPWGSSKAGDKSTKKNIV